MAHRVILVAAQLGRYGADIAAISIYETHPEQTRCLPATATTDFLAPNILAGRRRASPARSLSP